MSESTVRKKVLVVDDEQMLRFLYVEMLKKLGYQAIIASDYDEAIEVFKANASVILCVIMDVSLTGINGLETMKALKSIDPETRVILSSGHDKLDLQDRFDDIDTIEYLQKPYNVRQLKEAIENPLLIMDCQTLAQAGTSAGLKVV